MFILFQRVPLCLVAIPPVCIAGLPINVTHDHRDYMGLTDTLRGTELAPTHVHTYVHSGTLALSRAQMCGVGRMYAAY